MPTEEELLAAIDANPEDDTPRLAHADWLEAQGEEERAAFIRAALAGERQNDWPWRTALPRVHGMQWEFRRGYPEVVWFESLTAFKKGWPLTAGHRVRHVAFRGLRNPTKLAAEPGLASIASLELSGFDSVAVLAILGSPHLGRLHHLGVRIYYSDSQGPAALLIALANLSVLAGLRSLHYTFSSDGLPAEPILALGGSPHLNQLRRLQLEGWLSAEALRALWRAPSLFSLTGLEILPGHHWSSEVHPGGLEDLGDGGGMPGLERFLYGCRGEEPGQAVAGATGWTRLRVLDLHEAKIGNPGAAALAGAAHLSRLERLVLRDCGVSDAGAAALAESTHLPSLSSLDLAGNVIGRAGVAALGRTRSLPALRTLSLARNPAPATLIETVETRFHEGLPPVEESAPDPIPAVAAVSAPLIGAVDEDGLVRAIWTDPFDPVARLVYADWLYEQGKPVHAALLRSPLAERLSLGKQLTSLIRQDAPCPFTLTLADGLPGVEISVRSLRSRAFEEHGPAWLRRHHVAEISPQGTPKDWAALFAADWLAHTRGLSFAGRKFDAVDALAASPHLAALTSLTFGTHHYRYNPLSLFREAGLRGLCRLSQVEFYLQAEGLQALCEAPFAPNLRHLAFGGTPDESLAALTDAAALAGLVTLELVVRGDSAVKILADARGLGSLRNLDLSRYWFSDAGLDALTGSPLLGRLNRLRITSRSFSTPALERLARALPPRCRLVLAGEVEETRRDALAAILGEGLLVNE